MRVAAQIDVSAPAADVWEFLIDPAKTLHFMHGVTRWELASENELGLGARFRMLMRAGSAEVGGLVEIVEHDEPSELAWNSITGIDQRGRWRLRERPHAHTPRTDVELRLSYGVAGAGIGGWLAERAAAPTVRGNLRRSLQQLKRQVEHEQLRREAARRRAAKDRAAAAG
jgi:uncharacterized membrane protein